MGIHFVNGADQHPDQGKKQKNDKNIQSNFRNRKLEDSKKASDGRNEKRVNGGRIPVRECRAFVAGERARKLMANKRIEKISLCKVGRFIINPFR